MSGGNRPATGGTESRGPVGHKQGPVGLGSTHFYKVFITYRLSQPVIYEWKGGHNFASKLTWPQKGRNYYRKADIILFNKVSQKWLPRIYPTLARKNGEKTFLEHLLDSEIFGPSPEVKTAQTITGIYPTRGNPGWGYITTKPVLFFGKTSVLLSDEQGNRYSTAQLSDTYAHIKLSESLSHITPLIVATMEIVQIVLTGAVKAAASRGMAVYIARKGALKAATDMAEKQVTKALIKSMLKNIGLASAKGTSAFVLAFLKEAANSGAEEKLRKQAESSQTIDYNVLKTAIASGGFAFSLTFVDECMGSLIGSFARQSGVDKTAREYISKKLIGLITTQPAGVLINAYRKAVLDKERRRTGNDKKAENYMTKELGGWFAGQMKGLLKDFIASKA